MPATTRNYEAMVIIKSILPEDTINGIVEKLTGILTSGGANLKETSRWGRRRLAYEISKQAEGYYVIFYFTIAGKSEVLPAFERACRYDENVLRHMVVNVPTRKRGLEIPQIVPSPGWLSEYRFEPRPMSRRPRPFRDGDAGGAYPAGPSQDEPVLEAAEVPDSEPAPQAN